ncbi:MAG: LysE family translocator [Cohaesibacter sp.]|jgi:threonine/homoserine/homoserine lactone efflux protein|nr:LysE family translocator [Cohaesibacter sp.]
MYLEFLKACLVGLAIAAPVGPIGLLCIRRTLTLGAGIGIASGLGAAVADGTYGLLAALGLSFSGILESHGDMMRLGSGLLLLILGGRIFYHGLTSSLSSPEPSANASPKVATGLLAFGSTYLLTIANPATFLSFVAMISALSEGLGSSIWGPYILVLGVFTGSALWWFFLVGLVSKLRHVLSPLFMKGIDLFSGLLLLGWGGWMAVKTLFVLF